jgi:hypothetical protein
VFLPETKDQGLTLGTPPERDRVAIGRGQCRKEIMRGVDCRETRTLLLFALQEEQMQGDPCCL